MATGFETEQTVEAEDFRTKAFTMIRPMNSTDINEAAIAAINEVNPVDTFLTINRERAVAGNSPTKEAIVKANQQKSQASLISEIHNVLGDETLSLEQKKEKVKEVSDLQSPLFDPRNIAATGLISQEPAHEELLAEEQNINWSANIKEWNEIKAYKQRRAAMYTSASHGGESTLVDLGEIVVSVIPFVEPALREDVALQLVDMGVISEDQVSSVMSPRTNQEAVNNTLKGKSLEEQKVIIEKVLSAIDNSTKAFGASSNDFMKIELMRSFLEDEHYTEIDGMLGDGVLLLDALAVVFPVLKASNISKALTKTVETSQEVLSGMRERFIRNGKSPASAAEMAAHTSVDTAKRYHEAITEGGEEVAEGIAGTSRADALREDLFPDPKSASDVINRKVENIDSMVSYIETIKKESGKTALTAKELEDARKAVAERLAKGSTEQISYRSAASQIDKVDESGNFQISAMYGATDTAGFPSAEEAIRQTLYSTQHLGTVKEDLKLYIRDASGDYKPFVQGAVDKPKVRAVEDFLVKLDMKYDIGVRDLQSMGLEDAKLVTSTIVDRLAPTTTRGKLSGFFKVFDSTFERIVSIPVLAEAERASRIGDVFKTRISSWTKSLSDLSDGQINRVDDYLRRANLEGIDFDRSTLAGKGFTTKELDVIGEFRAFQDDLWILENKVRVKELKGEGFVKVSLNEGSEFLGKEVKRGNAGVEGTIYVAKTGEFIPVRHLDTLGTELDDLKLFRLPAEVRGEGTSFTHVLAQDDQWRALRDFDEVLSYRKGYYAVDYVNPIFIEKNIAGKSPKAVATAGDVASAEREVARLMANNAEAGVTYSARKNVKDVSASQREIDTAQGRYKMKYRGKRLESANGVSDETMRAPIKDPLSSLIGAADKLAGRIATDEVMAVTKKRFVAKFKDVLEEGQYPSSLDGIRSNSLGQNKKVADAQVMYNWIEAQSRPNTNLTDPAIQQALTGFAEARGIKASKAELAGDTKAATRLTKQEAQLRRLAKAEPVAATKAAVYKVFVSLNPPRQLSLAVADTLKTMAIAPKYVARGGSMRDSVAMKMVTLGADSKSAAKLSGRSVEEIETLTREFIRSGLSSGIEHQASIAKGVKDAAEEITLQEAKKGKGKLTKFVEFNDRLGFQAAERLQNTASWLAFREAKVNTLGRFKLTQRELDEVTAEARHFAYSQTKAAAPSYNSSALAGVMQFAGVIHKGVSLVFPEVMGGSKILSGAQKVKLNSFFLATYGVSLTDGLDQELIKIENKVLRETLRSGLLWTAIHTFTGADMSTKNLNPADFEGFIDRLTAVVTGNWADATPALGLVDKTMKNAELVAGMFGVVGEDAFKLDTGDKAVALLKGALEFYPAASKFFEGSLVKLTRRSASKYNYTKDEDMTVSEAVFKRFGWTTKDEEDAFIIRSIAKASFEDKQQDVKQLIDRLKRVAAVTNMSNEDLGLALQGSHVFWKVYENDPEAQRMAKKALSQMFTQDTEGKSFQMLVKMLGFLDKEQAEGVINISTSSDEEKQLARDLVDAIYDVKGGIE